MRKDYIDECDPKYEIINGFNYMGCLVNDIIEKGSFDTEYRFEVFRTHVEITLMFIYRFSVIQKIAKNGLSRGVSSFTGKGENIYKIYMEFEEYHFYNNCVNSFYNIAYELFRGIEEIEITTMLVIRSAVEYLELYISSDITNVEHINNIVQSLISAIMISPMFCEAVNRSIDGVNKTKFGSTLLSSDEVFNYTSTMVTLTKIIGMLSSSSIELNEYATFSKLYRLLTSRRYKLKLESMKTLDCNIHKYHKEFGGKEDYRSTQRIRFLTGMY